MSAKKNRREIQRETERLHARTLLMTVEELRLAIASGHDIEATDRYGRTIVFYAITDGRPDLLSLLLSLGCSVVARDKEGLTPLHLAAIHGQVFALEPVLDAGAEIDARDSWGNTALFRAVYYYEREDSRVINFLLAHGADPGIKNNHEVSPRSLAWTIANTDVRKHFDRPANP